MATTRFSVSEVIEQAVRTERLGNAFYLAMAEQFKSDASLSNLFGKLAGAEIIHEARFQELHSQVQAGEPEGWDDVSEYMRAIVESEFFLGSEKALARMKNVRDAEEAIRQAIGFEKETILYFLWIRDLVARKDLVDTIIEEEKSHILWLNKMRKAAA